MKYDGCKCKGCGENPCKECGGNCHKLDEGRVARAGGTTYKQWSDAARKRTDKKRKMAEQLAGDTPGIGLANLAIKGVAGVASFLHGLGGSQQRSPKPKSTPKPKVKLNKP